MAQNQEQAAQVAVQSATEKTVKNIEANARLEKLQSMLMASQRKMDLGAQVSANMAPYLKKIEIIERQMNSITAMIMAKMNAREHCYDEEKELKTWRDEMFKAFQEYAEVLPKVIANVSEANAE